MLWPCCVARLDHSSPFTSARWPCRACCCLPWLLPSPSLRSARAPVRRPLSRDGLIGRKARSPRQEVTSSPYAIRAATAGTAIDVANGSVVKSLNNLRDDLTLAAGANVTITPNGNTLTLASAGVGGSGIWSVNGNNAYYTAGNVGIGTSTPANKLTVRTPTLGYGIEHTDGDIRLGTFVGRATGYLGTLSNHKLTFFANDNGFPNMTMTLDTAGRVGIGTDSPTAKLEVVAQDALRLIGYRGRQVRQGTRLLFAPGSVGPARREERRVGAPSRDDAAAEGTADRSHAGEIRNCSMPALRTIARSFLPAVVFRTFTPVVRAATSIAVPAMWPTKFYPHFKP